MLRTQRRRGDYRRGEYRCHEIDPTTGQPCQSVCSRPWNLKRHQRDYHQNQNREPTSMHYGPAAPRRNLATPIIEAQWTRIPALSPSVPIASMQARTATHNPAQMTQAPWRVASTGSPQALGSIPTMTLESPAFSAETRFSSGVPQTGVLNVDPRLLEMPLQDALGQSAPPPSNRAASRGIPTASDPTFSLPEESADQESQGHAVEYRTPFQPGSTSRFQQDFESDEAESNEGASDEGESDEAASDEGASDQSERDEAASDEAASEIDDVEMDDDRGESMSRLRTSGEGSSPRGRPSKKRKRTTDRGRASDARRKAAVPTYLVKRSKKTRGQQRGIDWLTAAGRDHFESTLETHLAQWGVKRSHRGTCVLLPEDWKAMDPVDLMTVFQDHKPPESGSSRAWYAFSDHATTLGRAKAWYRSWPRTGVELDNFIGCGPFQPMDGSHLCHQEHCIIHVVYESAAENVDRGDCCLEARFLRQDGRAVPKHCRKHRPPCLMQHATLTPREACYIQFAVLRQAKGMPPAPPIPRSRRFHYPTLESQLPSTAFPALKVNPEDLIQEAQSVKKVGKPDLLCAFCPCIKAYSSITAYWGHLVNKHNDIDDEARLREVFRTATLWRTYWEEYSDGGKYGNPTMAKLLQIEQQGFGWQQVLDWGLRP